MSVPNTDFPLSSRAVAMIEKNWGTIDRLAEVATSLGDVKHNIHGDPYQSPGWQLVMRPTGIGRKALAELLAMLMYYQRFTAAHADNPYWPCRMQNPLRKQINTLLKQVGDYSGPYLPLMDDRRRMNTAKKNMEALLASEARLAEQLIKVRAKISDIDRAYRDKAGSAHPDKGGSTEALATLNRARTEAKAAIE